MRSLIISAVAAALGVITVYLIRASQPDVPVAERIERECRREYGARGEDAVIRCRAELSVR